MKKIIIAIGALIALVAIAGVIKFNFIDNDVIVPKTEEKKLATAPSSPLDILITVDGHSVLLSNGKAEREIAPGSASKETFRVFGDPVYGDLDGDQDSDAIFFLTQEAGGSGTFYFVVVAVNNAGVYRGTNALFLGDRIAPQNINILKGRAIANFADRKTGESFAVQPSVGKSVWIHLDSMKLEIGEAVQNFEGEADSSRMTLDMKTWKWVETADGGVVTKPKVADKFSVTFKKDNTVSVGTDCNSMGGTYTAKGSSLLFGQMMSTLMYCEGTQEGEFSAMLGQVTAFEFTGKGELLLQFGKSGVATFR